MSGEHAQWELNNPQSQQDLENNESVSFETVKNKMDDIANKANIRLDDNQKQKVSSDNNASQVTSVKNCIQTINHSLESLRPFVPTEDLEGLIQKYEAWLKNQDLSNLDSATIKTTAVNVSLLDEQGYLRDINQGGFLRPKNADKKDIRIQRLLFDRDINGHNPQDFNLLEHQKAYKWVLDCFDEVIHEPAFYQDFKKRQQCTRSNIQVAQPSNHQVRQKVVPSKYIINKLITSAYETPEFISFITHFLDNEIKGYGEKLKTTPASQLPKKQNHNQSYQQAVAPIEHANIQRVLNSQRVNKKLKSSKQAAELKSIVCGLVGFNTVADQQARQLKNYYLKCYLQPEGYLKKDEAGKRHFYLKNDFSRNLANKPEYISDIANYLVDRINQSNDTSAYRQLDAMFDQPISGQTVFMQTLQDCPGKAAQVVRVLSSLPEGSKKTNYMNAFLNKGWSKSRNQRIDAFLNNQLFYDACSQLYQQDQLPRNSTFHKTIQRDKLKAKNSVQTTPSKHHPDRWQSSVSALFEDKTEGNSQCRKSYSYSQLCDSYGVMGPDPADDIQSELSMPRRYTI